jgi:hypothetical protein
VVFPFLLERRNTMNTIINAPVKGQSLLEANHQFRRVPKEKLVDEIDRITIRLPTDATVFRTPTFLALTLDAEAGSNTPVPSLLPEHECLRYLAQYELMSVLCARRAQWAVDGRLRCQGSRVTPERYLGLWRKALTEPLSPQEVFDQRGWSLVARLNGPLSDASLMKRKSGWTCCPFQTFGGFQARYRDRLQDDGTQRFSVDIDLAEPDGARNAFHGRSLLSSVIGQQGHGRRG